MSGLRSALAPRDHPAVVAAAAPARRLYARNRAAHRRPLLTCAAASSSSSSSSSSPSSPSRLPVVILPGLGNASGDYDVLVADLEQRGFCTRVAQVRRIDWLRNATSLTDPAYWNGNLNPRPTVDWYLERISRAIEATGAEGKVSLLAHSAGGWLARVYLDSFGTDSVAALVTLGSPHLPPPKDINGVVDQTRGILSHCSDRFPGAVHAPNVKYVTIAGSAVQGMELGEWWRRRSEKGLLGRAIVGFGYKQVCGKADVPGDGITPVPTAHLEDAVNITLDGVYHSPIASDPSNGRPWYGDVLDLWESHLLS